MLVKNKQSEREEKAKQRENKKMVRNVGLLILQKVDKLDMNPLQETKQEADPST